MKTRHQTKQPHGKMTVKKLAAQNRGLQSVEVTNQNIGSFNRIARKYGIDFAPFKAKGQDRYLIFFKSQDADAMTAAFKEYTEQIGNMDTSIFLGGKEPTTLKELSAALGKETIDTFNTGESRGREVSHSLNYQKLGKDMPYLLMKSSVALIFT